MQHFQVEFAKSYTGDKKDFVVALGSAAGANWRSMSAAEKEVSHALCSHGYSTLNLGQSHTSQHGSETKKLLKPDLDSA